MNEFSSFLTKKYAQKKMLILGFGREGQSTYRVLRKVFPEQEIFVSDQNLEKNVANVFATLSSQDKNLLAEPVYLADLQKYDVIFKTPGISLAEPAIQKYIQNGGLVTSQLREFLEVFHQQVIGVTGTKGKSTTSSLIYHILKTNGVPTTLIGNIGIPVWESLTEITPELQIVIEMSSYQLELVTQSPHIAVFLNIYPEHLNYHGSFENYLAAKARITQFQTADDILIYNKDAKEVAWIASHTAAQLKSFTVGDLQKPELQKILVDPKVANLNEIIRQNNVLPAYLVAKNLGMTDQQIIDALASFQALPHRLEKVGTFKEITFYDDTLATLPEATCLALDSFPKVNVAILGGYDRGIDYTKVVDKVMEKKVGTVLFFKPSGQKMFDILQQKYGKELSQNQQPKTIFVETMEEAVKLSYEHAQRGGVVLLSPASPSFGHFSDYEDKSAQFVHWVKELGN